MPLLFWFNCVSTILLGRYLGVFMCYRSNLTVLSNFFICPHLRTPIQFVFLDICSLFLVVLSQILANIGLYILSPSICQMRGNSCVIKCIPCKFSLINCGSWIFSTVVFGCSIRSIDVAVSWMFSSVNCASW